MAWRPYENLIEGELDNTVPGRVTGWMRFVGKRGRITFDLKGDFHRDIRGCKVRLSNPEPSERGIEGRYMQGFASTQTGNVGDMTAGLPPQDYTKYPYFEWYGDKNGRVVLELEREQVEVVGSPLPPETQEPVNRQEQAGLLVGALGKMLDGAGLKARSMHRTPCGVAAVVTVKKGGNPGDNGEAV